MSPQTILCGIAGALFLIFVWGSLDERNYRTALGCAAVALIFGYFSYQGTTPEHMAEIAAEQKATADAELREQTPHVIREADGCKVYAFKSGDRYHFFTRCPDSKTTTESSWDECQGSGKTRHCEVRTENIEATK